MISVVVMVILIIITFTTIVIVLLMVTTVVSVMIVIHYDCDLCIKLGADESHQWGWGSISAWKVRRALVEDPGWKHAPPLPFIAS